MKAKDCAKSLCFDTSMSSDDDNNESVTDSDSTLNDLISLLPSVFKNLENDGNLKTYIKFNELLAAGKFR